MKRPTAWRMTASASRSAVDIVVWLSALLFGLGAIWVGARFRSGHFRGLAVWHDSTNQVDVLRNAVFGTIPLGVGFVSGALAILIPRRGLGVLVSGSLGFVIPLVSMLVAMIFIARPPRFLKPQWLLASEEHRNGTPRRRSTVLFDRTVNRCAAT